MSVFTLSPAEFGAIADTLRLMKDSLCRPIFPLSMAERWEHEVLVEPHERIDEEAFTLSLIRPFVFRLYLANALAERYTYWKDGTTAFTIPLFELPRGKILPPRELLRALESLSYNLVTNGGNMFLGVTDAAKLDQVLSAVRDTIIRTDAA